MGEVPGLRKFGCAGFVGWGLRFKVQGVKVQGVKVQRFKGSRVEGFKVSGFRCDEFVDWCLVGSGRRWFIGGALRLPKGSRVILYNH